MTITLTSWELLIIYIRFLEKYLVESEIISTFAAEKS